MSDETWKKSLRRNSLTWYRPKAIQRQVRPNAELDLQRLIAEWELSVPTHNAHLIKEIPAPKPIVIRERLHSPQQIPAPKSIVIRERFHSPQKNFSTQVVDKMHPACCKCRKDIDPQKIFTTDCCDNQYMICRECYVTIDEYHATYTCFYCETKLSKAQFWQMDTRREKKHPKCDICNKMTESSNKLPCKHLICKECFDKKEKFVKNVTDGKTVTEQYFVCCAKHGPEQTLYPLQRVHKISYGPQGTFDAFACVWCERLLEGKAYELSCGHLSCEQCYHYCGICRIKQTVPLRKIDMSDIKIAEVMNEEFTSYSENIQITQVRCPLKCSGHQYKGRVELHCGTTLCVTCIEQMVETTLISFKTDESHDLQEHCICICSTERYKHLLPLCFLQKAVSEISYLTDSHYCCSNTPCINKGVVEFRDCNHVFCRKCIKEMLSEGKKTENEKLHGKRRFCLCKLCDVAVPSDKLEQYVQDHQTVLTKNGQVLVGAGMSDAVSQQTRQTLEDKQPQRTTRIEAKHSFEMENLAADRDAEPAKPITADLGTDVHKQTTRTDNSSRTKYCLKDETTGFSCNNKSCYEKPFVEFLDCSHKMCLTCLNKRLNTNGNTVLVCGIRGCRKEIPVCQLVEYRLKKGPCDNPDCNADKSMRTIITRTFPECDHKLCVMCTSLQQTEHDDNSYCMAAECRPSKRDYGQMSDLGHSSYIRHQREIMGIPNIGLTCYASCILQILGQTPGFTEGLEKYSQQSEQNHVDKVLKNLLENVNVGADGQFIVDWNLMELLMKRISHIDGSFRRYQENDCHSFIMTLLNVLKKEDTEKETKTGEVMNSFLEDETSNGKSRKKGKPTVTKDTNCSTAIEQGQCPVALFESRLISKFTYGNCLHEDTVDDQLFHSILLPVQENVQTLESGLHLFFKGEEFANSILPCRTCDVPNARTVTTRVLQISKAPEILMLQLARFEEVPMAGSYKELRKTGNLVQFGKSLTLKKEHFEDRKELEYELYGVVIHSGSMHGGHYSSYVRKQNTNRWFFCSDSSVYEENESKIFEEWTFRHAYVLFYSKKREPDGVCEKGF